MSLQSQKLAHHVGKNKKLKTNKHARCYTTVHYEISIPGNLFTFRETSSSFLEVGDSTEVLAIIKRLALFKTSFLMLLTQVCMVITE